MAELVFDLSSLQETAALCGEFDRNLAVLRKTYGIDIVVRDCTIKLIGEEDKISACKQAVDCLAQALYPAE